LGSYHFAPSECNLRPVNLASDYHIDEREQLVNDRQSGPIAAVSVAEAGITRLNGILLDFDPDRLHPDLAPPSVLACPDQLWHGVVRAWLDRHPVFARAEVRSSGRGLHVIVWLSPPVEFETEADRQKWAAVVKILQKLLPTDPDCPGITAMTRPLGSVNSRNGVEVRLLRPGEPISADDVLEICRQAVARPFGTVAGLLFADKRVSPCPVCRVDGSRLDVLDHAGMCYGRCGKVRLGQLFDCFLRPRGATKGAD
jgi:hypothetical protein